MGKLIHEALSEHILGAAMTVLNDPPATLCVAALRAGLKPGLDACPPLEGKAL
jgi:hypothetical protein